ncbi:MAG: hypothetical protein KGL35_01600 [Bradyrhizobium sp.]|nr:hypothetical protein [Bradyrhizobium sp.]
MIPRDAAPVGHHTPLPRIDPSPRFEAAPDEQLSIFEEAQRAREDAARTAENERIWQLVRQVGGGEGTTPTAPGDGDHE